MSSSAGQGSMLGVGVIGTGGMGAVHAAAFMRNPHVQVVAAAGRNPERLRDFADGRWPPNPYLPDALPPSYAIERVYTDWRELVADRGVHLVSICTPNELHFSTALAALEAGKHVLVEKPLVTRAADGVVLARKAREAGLVLMTAHMWRFHPHVQYARKVVQEGLVGRVLKAKGYGIHVGWAPDSGWFTRREESGGGALIDMGVHPLDTLRYVLGGPRATRVYAAVGTAFGSYDVDDHAVVMVHFEGDAVALVEAGWGHPHSDGIESSVQIFGTEGYLRVFPTSLTLPTAGARGAFVPELEGPEGAGFALYQAEVDHFVEVVRKEAAPIITPEDGLEVVRIVEAAYRSQATGAPVSMEL